MRYTLTLSLEPAPELIELARREMRETAEETGRDLEAMTQHVLVCGLLHNAQEKLRWLFVETGMVPVPNGDAVLMHDPKSPITLTLKRDDA